jgi:anti-sigma B factor antagonist
MSTTPSPQALTLDIVRNGTTTTIRCHGRLVYGSGNILYSAVCPLLPETRHLILDLGELSFMDSMGLGTLVRIYVSATTAGCKLELIHLGKRIQQLLGTAGLLNVFSVLGEHGVPMKF